MTDPTPGGGFEVRLEQFVCALPGGDTFGVTLRLTIRLPFAPYPGLLLGLEKMSDFHYDEAKVERVMWQHHDGRFLVALPVCRGGQRSAQLLVDHGWRLARDDPHDTPEKADSSDPGFYFVVEIDGRFYGVDKHERWCLDAEGTPYRVVTTPREVPGD